MNMKILKLSKLLKMMIRELLWMFLELMILYYPIALALNPIWYKMPDLLRKNPLLSPWIQENPEQMSMLWIVMVITYLLLSLFRNLRRNKFKYKIYLQTILSLIFRQ